MSTPSAGAGTDLAPGPGAYGLPPVLYVPVAPTVGAAVSLSGQTLGAGTVDVEVVMLPSGDDRRALPVYTAMDRLLDQWGASHPWVVVLTSALDEIESQQPFDALLVDLEVPADLRID